MIAILDETGNLILDPETNFEETYLVRLIDMQATVTKRYLGDKDPEVQLRFTHTAGDAAYQALKTVCSYLRSIQDATKESNDEQIKYLVTQMLLHLPQWSGIVQ